MSFNIVQEQMAEAKLTKKEIEELSGLVALSTSLFRIFLFVLAVSIVGTFLYLFSAVFTSGLIQLLIWLIPTAVVAFALAKKGKHWTGGSELRNRVKEDLKGGVAHVLTVQAQEAIEIEEVEDEGSGYFLKLPDNMVMFVQSQNVDDWKRRGFPWTEFMIRRAPKSGIFLGVKRNGEKLQPTLTRPPLTDVEIANINWNDDYAIFSCDFEKLKSPSTSWDAPQ